MAEERQDYIFCTRCGAKNSASAKFCTHCGAPLVHVNRGSNVQRTSTDTPSQRRHNVIDSTTSKINEWTGGQGAVDVSLKGFFGQVFKHHTEQESEDIFAVGTAQTTPSLDEVVNDRVQPWLFSRILVFIFLVAVLLWILSGFNPRLGIVVSLDTTITVAVPVSALVLFFEANVYKNISIYQVMKIMLVGGVLSLIASMLLDNLLGSTGSFDLVGALITGIAEEVGKVLVAACFIYKFNIKRIFNGLLVGAAVGSGFAAFENVMYMINDQTGQLSTISAVLLRTLSSISTHTEWCAITADALVLAKGSAELTTSDFFKGTFLKFLGSVILIHAFWDWNFLTTILKFVVLAIIAWLFVFVLIHAGLREVKELQLKMKKVGQ